MAHEPNPADWPVKGRWRGTAQTPGDATTLNDNQGVFAVHAALMHTGRILMFSGRTEGAGYLYRSWSWDPAGWERGNEPGVFDNVEGRWFDPDFDPVDPDNPTPEELTQIPTWSEGSTIDLFCAHQVFMEDGRLLVVGGASGQDEGDARGNPAIYVYDPRLEKWEEFTPSMTHGRWYPTAVTLADGQVAIFSGRPRSGGSYAVDKVEVVGPPDYEPREINGSDRRMFIYPCLFLTGGGKVFYVPTGWRYEGITKENDAATVTRVRNEQKSTGAFRLVSDNTGVWEPDMDLSPSIEPDNSLREEGTAVLLPPARDGRILMIGGGLVIDRGEGVTTPPPRHIQHSSADPRSCEILETNGPNPQWVPAGTMHYPRVNVTAVLLPNGKVLIIGGHNRYKWSSSSVASNIAEIYDPTVAYDPADPSAAFTPVAEMHFPRIYHSTALLLPDGRVWVASGEGLGNPDSKTMEFYEPPYLHQGTQPQLGRILREDYPVSGEESVDQVRYGGDILIEFTSEAPIEKVVFMRPGAITHHTDSEQRYEDIPVSPTTSSPLRVRVPSDPSVLPPGYYMLWIVDNEGRPCERAKFVRLSHQHCSLFTDKSHYSSDEYAAKTFGGGSVAEFENALYVVVHGFIPSQLGITTTTPNNAQLNAYAPDISFTEGDGGTVPQITAHPTDMHLEVAGDSLDIRQRITFEYKVRISSSVVFPGDDDTSDTRPVSLSTSFRGYRCTGEIILTRQPNPFMLDGPTHWLSLDVRVFALKAGNSIVNESDVPALNAANPNQYIANLLDYYNSTGASPAHPFNSLDTDQQDSRLYLSSELDGTPVFNFAVAQVRYQGLDLTANDVRVFFRTFTTAVTSLAYNPVTYPNRTVGSHILPDVGQNASNILSIPYFAAPRDSIDATGDPQNVDNLVPHPEGREIHRYYGAWLDFNQETPRYTDPEDGVLKSIQQLVRGEHQCLVAEINYDQDPIPIQSPAVKPANNDNLAQRNLAIVPSDNPGGPDAHKILHTFDFKPTWPGQIVFGQELATHAHFPTRRLVGGPDELMILWGDLPRDSKATLFMPSLDADQIVALANMDYGPERVKRVDAHTVECQVADVTYIPIPAQSNQNIAGLITIQLPDTVLKGQEYRVEVRQVSHVEDRVVGTFELLIPVSSADALLPNELQTLSVMKYIGMSISTTSRWYAVFQRYLEGLSNRVRGFGGDPTRVYASPKGDGGLSQLPGKPGIKEDPPQSVSCRRLSYLVSILTAFFVMSFAVWEKSEGLFWSLPLAVILVGAIAYWQRSCHPSICRHLTATALGAGIAAVTLGFLYLIGVPVATLALGIGAFLGGGLLIGRQVYCQTE